jgi:hypothetical protein
VRTSAFWRVKASTPPRRGSPPCACAAG